MHVRLYFHSQTSDAVVFICVRRVKENRLHALYGDLNPFRINVNTICSLAFVPPRDVGRAFDLLCLQFGDVGMKEQVILKYFERTYVGEVRGGVRAPPLFKHSLWNVYDRVINDLTRTTNEVEGWDNGFNRSVGQCHANVRKSFSRLLNEHAAMHLRIGQAAAGVPASQPSRVYRQLNQQVKNIVHDYPNPNTIQYLRSLSYTFN